MKKTRYAFLGILALSVLVSCRTAPLAVPEKAHRELSALLPELRQRNPEWREPQMELLPSSPGKLRLLLGGRGLQDLSLLKDYDYEELILDRTGNDDLRFIGGLNVESLMIFSEREISLQGIGGRKNLRKLSVKYLSPRHNLPKISFKPLGGLELHSLRVENAHITDPTVPVSLKALAFGNCLGLSDLSFLTELRKLETLEFINCLDLQTGKLPALPVSDLSLAFSPLSDSAALRKLHNLKSLTLNAPERIDFLQGMAVENLSVNGNTRELDISVLPTLPLRGLELSAVKITDLRPLANCRSLETLNLTLNGINDISPLRGLPLRALFLAGNNIENPEPLRDCAALNTLYLTQCHISSLEPLAKLPLETLKIERCLVYDLAPVAKMPLRTFWLINCPVSDIGVLRNTRIEDLMLNDCSISNLEPLTGMTRLEKVYLRKLPALLKPLPEGIRGEIIIKEDSANAGV